VGGTVAPTRGHIQKENNMGIFDKLKGMAGKAKDTTDDVVEQHSDKVPDEAEKVYDQVSDAAEKVIPGEDKPAEGAAE
jgi:hypothetical protein